MSCFTHLHVHSEFSILESSLRLSDMIDLCVKNNMNAVALTDNGSMYGSIDFYLKAKEKGIKAIIGCELYVTENIAIKQRARRRLILLAKNYKGYQNLIKIVSTAYIDGFYYRPRVDMNILRAHNQDLIAISPGLNGVVADAAISHQDSVAKQTAEQLKQIYQNDFYLGIQRCQLPFEDLALTCSQQLAKQFDISLVVTNDVYYKQPDYAYTRDILTCIQTGRLLEDQNKGKSQSQEHYFKSSEQMQALFSDFPEALNMTQHIADQCNVHIDTDQVTLPRFDCPDNLSSKAYLEKKVWQGIDQKYEKRTEEIKQRVETELSIILNMDYANYFLIIDDFLSFCLTQGIPVGPGRGSAAGSIVAYALNITKIDPLKYNLLFERFLNPERVSMPDIDIDFCIKRRQEVIQYIVDTYGQERVSQIITFGTMQSRAVVRDIGRVLGVPLDEVDFLAKCIPAAPGKYTSIKDALDTIPELKASYDGNPAHKRLLDISQVLEGQVRHTSTHAAGVVISRDPLTDVVPLVKNDDQIATQYPMSNIDNIGLLKMDILGLRNLTVMHEALQLIDESKRPNLDQLRYDDKATYDLLCTGDTIGVFQLESQGMQKLVKDLQPKVFEDLIALLALYRPGPLGSGMVQDFISNKSGKTKVKYDVNQLEPILHPTYGMIVYQEQVMQIASVIGGFSLGQADMLRRAMGKKKKSEMDKMKVSFLAGAKKNKIPEQKAVKIFDLCYKFAEYGFNKSHSAAYALISYQTAYLKAHFPVAYMTALLSSVLGSGEKAALYVNNCKKMNISILKPCINKSKNDFIIETNSEQKNSIRLGLAAIKNVGEGAIESIVSKRPDQGYKDLFDFCLKVDLRQVNKRVIESLIFSGAMDVFDQRNILLSIYESTIEQAQQKIKEIQKGQVSLFASMASDQDSLLKHAIRKKAVSYSELSLLKSEKELLGMYVSGHPLAQYKKQFHLASHCIADINDEMHGTPVKLIVMITDYRKIITKRNQPMVSMVLEDMENQINSFIFFQRNNEDFMDRLKNEQCVLLKGEVKVREGEVSILAETAVDLAEIRLKSFYLNIDHLNTKDINYLHEWCKKNKGDYPLVLQLNDTLIQTGSAYWINDDPKTQEELENMFGKGRVWINT